MPRRTLTRLGCDGVTGLRRLHGGSTTEVWRVDTSDGRFALRLFAAETAVLAEREVAALHAAAGAGIPVPSVVALGDAEGRPAMLMEWVEGATLFEEVLRRPRAAGDLGHVAGRMQARINAVPAPDGWPAREWMSWGSAGPSRADARASSGDARMLLHLDFHPGNLLVRGNEIVGVIDWVNARAGPGAADLARTYTIIAADPTVDRPRTRLRRELWHGWHEGYRELAGETASLVPYVAWAGDVMVEDLRHRLSPDQLATLRRRWDRWGARARRGPASGTAR